MKKGSHTITNKYLSLFLDTLALSFVFFWAELIMHLGLKMELRYLPIFTLFAFSFGAVFNFLLSLFPYQKAARIKSWFALIISLIYVIEFEAKQILATFYPFTILGTAAGNKLDDYIGAVISTVIKTFGWIIVFFIPAIVMLIFYKVSKKPHGYKKRAVVILSLVAAILFYGLGWGVSLLPWNGDITPKEMLTTTGNYDSQVEMVGLSNMLRLDIKYNVLGFKQADPDIPIIPDDPESKKPDNSRNILPIDWKSMINGTNNADRKYLAQYFSTVSGTKKNDWTGKFEGYNVIFLSLEGMSGYGISEKYTPTLYKLVHEGFYCKNFYTALHYTSTSGGECQNLLGLYPENNRISMRETGVKKTNTYFSLATILKDYGYDSFGYHNNGDMYGRAASHRNLGYNWKYIDYTGSYKPLEDCISWEGSGGVDKGKLRWPQRDSYLIDVTTSDYINSDKPFNVYYMTISGHMPYSWNWWASEYKDDLADSGYSNETQMYIASCMEVDKAFAHLLEQLEAAGQLEKTLIVAAPDHIPYFNPNELEELAGIHFADGEALQNINERNIDFEVYHSACIIWSASMKEPVEINKVCCQVDLLPTILNLLGVKYDSRVLGGTDILSDSEGLVVFSSRSWRSDAGFYNSFTQKFTPAEGVNMSEAAQKEYVQSMRNLSSARLAITAKILNCDFYDYAFEGGKFLIDESSLITLNIKKVLIDGIFIKTRKLR